MDRSTEHSQLCRPKQTKNKTSQTSLGNFCLSKIKQNSLKAGNSRDCNGLICFADFWEAAECWGADCTSQHQLGTTNSNGTFVPAGGIVNQVTQATSNPQQFIVTCTRAVWMTKPRSLILANTSLPFTSISSAISIECEKIEHAVGPNNGCDQKKWQNVLGLAMIPTRKITWRASAERPFPLFLPKRPLLEWQYKEKELIKNFPHHNYLWTGSGIFHSLNGPMWGSLSGGTPMPGASEGAFPPSGSLPHCLWVTGSRGLLPKHRHVIPEHPQRPLHWRYLVVPWTPRMHSVNVGREKYSTWEKC